MPGSARPDDVAGLAQYALADTDDLLADPDTAGWAAVRILDGLVTMWRGASSAVSAAVAEMMRGRARTDQAGGHVRSWPVDDRWYRADDAAFLLGTFAFSESYSDTGLASVAHPGSVVVPAVLLASQLYRTSGRDALAAVVVGYNIMEALGSSLNGGNPRMTHQLKGFRPTASAGPAAACAVVCRLAGLSADGTRRALSIACNQGGGLRRHPRTGLSALYVQSGEAVRRALQSAELATAGIDGDDAMLFGDGGFMAAYSAGPRAAFRLPVAGAPGAVATASVKLDCTPHTFITALDAARQLAGRDLGARPGQVTVRLPQQHWHAAGGDRAWAPPDTLADAMYNLPFCVAAAITSGQYLYPRQLAQALADPAVAALAPRVRVTADSGLTARFDADPATWPAIVAADAADGAQSLVELARPLTFEWSAAQTALAVAAKAGAFAAAGRAPDRARLTRLPGEMGNWTDFWDSLLRLAPLSPAADQATAGARETS